MALIELDNGTLVDAPVLNTNFDYLDRKIDSTKQEITGDSNVTVASLASQVLSLSTGINTLVPVGTIIWHIGDPSRSAYAYIPEGYLLCNGDLFLKSSFPTLSAILDGRFDLAGDDPLKFRTPNLCGTDPNGYGGYFTKGTFKYSLVGEKQEGYVGTQETTISVEISGTTGTESANHRHWINEIGVPQPTVGNKTEGALSMTGSLEDRTPASHTHEFSGSDSIKYDKTTYTEPRYMFLLPCIKY